MKHLIYILLLLPFLAYSQANRVKVIQDNTGVFRGSVAPTDTSLTWRNTTDGNSYFWDVGAQSWNIVQLNYEVDSVGSIALNSYPTGAMIQSKGYYEFGDGGDATYYVYDSKIGYENEDTLGAVFQTANSKFAIMDTNYPLNVLSLGVNREQEVSGGRDTEVMQKIFDYCSKTIFQDVIYIPRSFVDINETLYYNGNNDDRGFSIVGDSHSASGSYGSSIIWRGSNYDTIIRIERVKDFLFEKLDLNGNNKAGIGIYFEPLSNHIIIEKSNIGGFIDTVGTISACVFANPSIPNQISEITIKESQLNGANYGFAGGNANNKDFYIYNSSFQQNDTAIWIGNTGSAEISGNTFAGNNVCIACVSCKGTSIISNESEGDSLFYYSGENSSILQSQSLISNFSSLANGKKIAIYGDGRIQLIGNFFEKGDGLAAQIQWADATSVNDAIFAVQNFFQNSAWIESNPDTFPFIDLTGNVYDVNNIHSIQNTGGGTGVNSTTFPDLIRMDKGMRTKYYDNVIFEANIKQNDTVRVEGAFQAEYNMILGPATPGSNFSIYHDNDVNQWTASDVFWYGKHMTSGFGLWLRGGPRGRLGIDGSTIVGSSGLGFWTNSTERAAIDINGNFGVGIAPTEKFQVNGNCVISGTIYLNTAKTLGIFTGTGSPEGAVTASVGSTFHRTDGGASTTLYVKESGTGNTGWVAK